MNIKELLNRRNDISAFLVHRKRPTSVALDDATVSELKRLAGKQGIPYQVLIRVFILDGLEHLRKAA